MRCAPRRNHGGEKGRQQSQCTGEKKRWYAYSDLSGWTRHLDVHCRRRFHESERRMRESQTEWHTQGHADQSDQQALLREFPPNDTGPEPRSSKQSYLPAPRFEHPRQSTVGDEKCRHESDERIPEQQQLLGAYQSVEVSLPLIWWLDLQALRKSCGDALGHG